MAACVDAVPRAATAASRVLIANCHATTEAAATRTCTQAPDGILTSAYPSIATTPVRVEPESPVAFQWPSLVSEGPGVPVPAVIRSHSPAPSVMPAADASAIDPAPAV